MRLLTSCAEGRALLAAVVATPDDDTPRLVAADWLAENGDEDRAQLIRLQCRLHPYRLARAAGLRCTAASAVWCPVCGDCACPDREDRMDDPFCPLHAPDSPHDNYRAPAAEEWRLWAAAVTRVTVEATPPGCEWHGLYPNRRRGCWAAPSGTPLLSFGLSRGFVDRVRADQDDFLATAAHVFAQAPIRAVQITGATPNPDFAYGGTTRNRTWDWRRWHVDILDSYELRPELFEAVAEVAAARPATGCVTMIDHFVEFPSSAAARDALALAALRLGRARAGLKPPAIPLVLR